MESKSWMILHLRVVNMFSYLGADEAMKSILVRRLQEEEEEGGEFYQCVRHLLLDKQVSHKAKMMMFQMNF